MPHARTLRKAREYLRQMVASGVSPRKIRSYLRAWLLWWVRTVETWTVLELLSAFLEACWEPAPAAYAAGLVHHYLTLAESKFPPAIPTNCQTLGLDHLVPVQ